jgi:hypothetical protein
MHHVCHMVNLLQVPTALISFNLPEMVVNARCVSSWHEFSLA